MKNLLSIFLFFCIGLFEGSAQEKSCIKNFYGEDDFLGTWQWTSHRDTFTIKLIKDTIYYKPLDTVLSMITGWHKFVSNGEIIDNSLKFSDSVKNRHTTIAGFIVVGNILSFVFSDLTRDRSFEIKFEIFEGDKNRAIWNSHLMERIRVNEPPPKIREGQTVPNSIVLKKIMIIQN